MRIERLALARYGHFTDREIDLDGDGVCMHVLLGANEAGKTTALNAITDLLFGIGRQTPFDFRHGYKDLRIGATLSGSDGRRLTVRRRKGNQNTLLDEDDRPLDERVLAALLGGADRAIFTGLFGLTHESLRAGGDDMLAAKGDLGRMLFEAGSSMAGIADLLDGLEAEAGQLFTPRRSATRAFYMAEDARNAAERGVRTLALSFDDWRRNQEERAQAEAALEEVRRRLGQLEERRTRLERIRRTGPRLSALRGIEAELATLAAVPAVPGDAGERLEAARRTLAVARSRQLREEADAARAEAAVAALVVPDALLAAADEVQRLYERRVAVLDGRGALPELLAGRAALDAELGHLLAQLGCGALSEEACLPAETALTLLRDLINQDAVLGEQRAEAEARHGAAAAAAAEARVELAAAAVPPDLSRLALALEQAQCPGDLEADLAEAEQDRAKAGDALARTLAALRLWPGDAESLAAFAVPEQETILRYEREIGEAQRRALRAEEALAEAREEAEHCRRQLTALGDATSLPTAEAVAAARALRDEGWALIRRVFIGPDEPGDGSGGASVALAPKPVLAERYERTVREADAIADRRQADAERLARHQQLSADLDAARRRSADRAEEAERRDRALNAVRDGWQALWRAIGVEPEPPREMGRWLARRDDVLRARDQDRTAMRALRRCGERLSRERDGLAAALAATTGLKPDTEAPLSALIREARLRLEAGRAAVQARAVVQEKCSGAVAALRREEARVETLAARRRDWSLAWRAALERVGLPPDTAPAAGAAALALWDDVRRSRLEVDAVDRRIRRIEADAVAFAEDTARILAAVHPDLASGDPPAAAQRAFERLQAARRDALKREDLQARISSARAAARAAAADAGDATAEILDLAAVAGCAGEDELPLAIDRARRKASLIARAEELRYEIATDPDGMSLQAAVAEAEGADPDALQTELAAIKLEIAGLIPRTKQLGEQVEALRQQALGMETTRGAAEAEQARRNALATLEEVSERWLVLKTAAFLLRRAVEQFREQQQGPLLARAEALFRALTLGSFTRFRIDYDPSDRPLLLGVRADGNDCPTIGMSDGTRDQLFLALRLAAIERYLGEAEALPFVADDLFVHFDDARATAGLKSLIALGGKTQVLLFTHHRHLADLAREAGGPERVRVQVLAPAS